ncbi:Maf family protein [Calditrichota bacterium]
MKQSSVLWTLASKSPRRLALLRQIGINPIVIVPGIIETEDATDPHLLALKNAKLKANAVRNQVNRGILLAADTIVIFDGEIIGKPGSESEAALQLKILSNQWHEVISGYFLENRQTNMSVEGTVVTKVHFRQISSAEIEDYTDSGEPFDKAGGYGIQGLAASFVNRIEGCYFNVVGLPLSRIVQDVQLLLNDNF